MLCAIYTPYTLKFRFEARTSRSVMHEKKTYFVKVWDDENPDVYGVGECNLFQGLSAEDGADYEHRLADAIKPESLVDPYSSECSSIIFGLETALNDLKNDGKMLPFSSEWTRGGVGILTNGLVWMGDKQLMLERIGQKIAEGFRCIKLKIGGIDFEDELSLIAYARRKFPADVLEIRLDANGAFSPKEALAKLDRLAKFGIHSIEQPIAPRQYGEMCKICRESEIPIALDEELIGVRSGAEKRDLLTAIMPQYIILKPALCGGFAHAEAWTKAAKELGIRWWTTSALESNIGLNAIAQWAYLHNSSDMPQGLGTGALYHNNIASPLTMRGESLLLDNNAKWGEMPV